ncbi:MAG: SMC family ATPase [Meiothermus sp.]|uniref:SMC family ATPase n=1 Tax=Meiothermus sp. TaxID=1955249 RepID=UPI00298F2733|nr:SMC family ATPase [Meiothermus sp.]MDW8091279.1 SMC family ATPase [Meiothermus sp.]
MRPLRLSLQGFGPYLDPLSIPFDDVELFAITGQTGAGKTTLLDAITYALYKATPRIGGQGLRELVHPQAEAARVELEFRVGEQVWRVVRVVGRENQHRLERLENGQWRTDPASERARELDEKLVRILGMDYEAFVRAVLLPQGQFDLFLRGSPKERRETLSALYGLQSLGEMARRVSDRLRGLRERRASLEGELKALGEVQEEEVACLEEALEQLRADETRLEGHIQGEERELERLKGLEQKFEELERLRRRRGNWERAQPEMEELARRLEQAREAQRLWPHLKRLEELEGECSAAQAQLRKTQRDLEDLRQALAGLKEGFDPQRLEALRAQLAGIEALRLKEQALKRHGGHLELRHQNPLPFDEDRLQRLREAEGLLGQKEQAEKRLDQDKSRVERAQKQLEENQQRQKTLRDEMEGLKRQGLEKKGALQEAEARLAAEQMRQGLAQYHPHLRPGEPCPLCGQTVDRPPPKPEGEEVKRLKEEVDALKEELERLREDYARRQGQLKALEEDLPRLQRQLEEAQDSRKSAEDELQRLKDQLRDIASLEALQEERQQRLASLARELREATQGKGVADFERDLREELNRLEARREEIGRIEGELVAAQAKEKEESARVETLAKQLEGQRAAVQALLKEAGFEGPAALKQARMEEEELAAQAGRLEAHRQEEQEIAARLKPLEEELAGQTPVTREQVQTKEQGLQGLKEALRETRRAIGAKEARLEKLREDLKRRREALGEKAKLEQEIDLWERLSNDLRADRFPDYLLEHYQRGLVQRASELVQALSHNRYTLGLVRGEYLVFDRWTQAQRPVRTLSGGESFMASLSLALSLSEHLSQGRIGALFLDEGFGTLDMESLEQVAGVLEALPTQGRLVGIVTHVEALAERLPARLRVEKSPKGSRAYWVD